VTPENTIDYVEIPAKDPAKAKVFFTELFGWKFEDYGPDYCSFHDGRLAGGFHRANVTVSTDAGSPLIVFYKQDLAASRERVAELGGTISRDIFSFPGGRRFHFTDPNGNEYAIWSEK
jgi:predicted enzyme related to lactoylglutathione lyase